MASIWAYTIISVLAVSLISLAGLATLTLTATKLKKMLIYLVSFSAGALFGDAFLHLLPEAVEEAGGLELAMSLYVLAGIATLFIVEKVVRWRHCHVHVETMSHHAQHHHKPFAITNLFGDAVHNFIDGIIIGASYLASIPLGIATTLAVILHELPQEIGDFGVLVHGGFSRMKALFFNLLTALTAILGAVIALLLSETAENLTAFFIPFAAGVFIYIAGSDLIPELHKDAEAGESILQFGAFALGIAVMALLLGLE